ncbi:MAG: DUF2971 domain-containing protein, partial [Burkholderiales bacterium]
MTETANMDPEIVYHYTDQQGLLGILQNKEFWCTHIAYLNDASEHGFARTLLNAALTSIETNDVEEQKTRDHAKLARLLLNPHTFTVPDNANRFAVPIGGHYVGSFSEESDDLSLWRAYSNTGSRFAIGFFTDVLTQMGASCSMMLSKVDYNRDKAIAAIKDGFVQGIEDQKSRFNPAKGVNPDLGAYLSLCRVLVDRLGVFKHAKFHAEREWRLAGHGNEWKFRAGKSFVIPYTVLKLDPAQ